MLRARPDTSSLRRIVGAWIDAPSWRGMATVAAIAVTAILMFKLGIWYFVALIAVYAVIDILQRLEEKREARNMMAILAATGCWAHSVTFRSRKRHCERAAWIARKLGWIPRPIRREGWGRRSIYFVPGASAAPLSNLLQALSREKLVTHIALPPALPKLGRRHTDQSYREAGWGI